MGFEQQPGSGALFKNDKRDNPKAPDYRGTANIGGVTFEIAGWIKKTKNGSSFMSLSIKEKQAKEEKATAVIDENEDIHF